MKNVLLKVLPVLGLLVLGIGAAHAGTGGTEFDAIVTLLQDWAEGSLGRVLALATLVVGLATGIIRQNIAAAVVGVSMALVIAYGPGVITGVVTAVI